MRSLLQKAVRRGNTDVVHRAASRLHEAGDKTWLRSRIVVITFEECWPTAGDLKFSTQFESRTAWLQRIASTTKQKDAAGLGALAAALAAGHNDVLQYSPQQQAVRTVCDGLERPAPFFEWAEAHSKDPVGSRVVATARRFLPSATWPWDKACLLAAAYLVTLGPPPQLPSATRGDGHFPYWVALDKHTPQGKDALRQLARDRSIPYRQLTWASFYFESARVNSLVRSPWWDAERTWRLARAGLTTQTASQLWQHVRSDFASRLAREAEQLRQETESAHLSQPNLL